MAGVMWNNCCTEFPQLVACMKKAKKAKKQQTKRRVHFHFLLTIALLGPNLIRLDQERILYAATAVAAGLFIRTQ